MAIFNSYVSSPEGACCHANWGPYGSELNPKDPEGMTTNFWIGDWWMLFSKKIRVYGCQIVEQNQIGAIPRTKWLEIQWYWRYWLQVTSKSMFFNRRGVPIVKIQGRVDAGSWGLHRSCRSARRVDVASALMSHLDFPCSHQSNWANMFHSPGWLVFGLRLNQL